MKWQLDCPECGGCGQYGGVGVCIVCDGDGVIHRPDPDNVRYCPHCGAKTWHHDDTCEWIDMHRNHDPDARAPPQ